MSAEKPTPSLWQTYSLALLLCLLGGFLAYLPALPGTLIWDDLYLVGENPFFRSPVFALETFRHWLFFDSFSTYYRPVQNLSYMLDYAVWRGNPLGYHITNVLLHALSGFLLYCLLRRLVPPLLEAGKTTAAPWLALLVALVWTVHPIHNAAVAYISGRADSLASLFALSAWLLSFRARESTSSGRRIACAMAASLCGLLALCSKEIALMWGALFALHLLIFERTTPWRSKVAPLTVALMLVGLYALLHALPERRTPMQDGAPPPLAARGLLMLRALGDYTGLIFFPSTLHMERTLSDPTALRSAQAWRDHVRGDHLSALGLLAALGAIALCRSRAPGQSLRRFGALWFVAAFLPISNLFPLNAEVAEHWIYLASIGFILCVAASLLQFAERWPRLLAGAAALAVVALGVRTAVRADDWVDGETFCQRTVAAGGASPRVLQTLAAIYAGCGELDRQERLLRRMLERYPDYAPARIQLGVCLQRQGRNDEAAPLLQTSSDESRRHPRTWPAALQLARMHLESQRFDEALGAIAAARATFPDPWPLAEMHARILRERGDLTGAVSVVAEYAGARWWHLPAWQTLGELQSEAGATDEAIATLHHAARLDLYDPRPLTAIARVELTRGRGDAALRAQSEAIERQPEQRDSYLAMAAILEQLGRRPEAAALVNRAQTLPAAL